MSLITETGSGVAGATSYVSLAEADGHFAALGLDEWSSASEAARELALMRAALHIDSYQYPGTVLDWDQGLKWPRRGAADRDGRPIAGLPHALRIATLELAEIFLREAGGIEERLPIRQKIGPIEITFAAGRTRLSFVFRLLAQIGARGVGGDTVRG